MGRCGRSRNEGRRLCYSLKKSKSKKTKKQSPKRSESCDAPLLHIYKAWARHYRDLKSGPLEGVGSRIKAGLPKALKALSDEFDYENCPPASRKRFAHLVADAVAGSHGFHVASYDKIYKGYFGFVEPPALDDTDGI